MKRLLLLCISLTVGISCQSNKDKNQIIEKVYSTAWDTISNLIPEVKQSYEALIKDKITVNDFKESASALLQSYSFFFSKLKDQAWIDKYTELAKFVSSHNKSESVSAMKQVYTRIEKLNKEWQESFPTSESASNL